MAVDQLLRAPTHLLLNCDLFGREHLIYCPRRDLSLQSGFDGVRHGQIDIGRPEQIVCRFGDAVLHDRPHVEDVLVATEELGQHRVGGQRIGLVGKLSTDECAFQLADFELMDLAHRPRPVPADAGHGLVVR